MTTSRALAALAVDGGPVPRRLWGLFTTEGRLLYRMGVVTAVTVVTALWVAVVLTLTVDVRRVVVPLLLFTDVTAVGFLFVPALLVMERVERTDAAMRLTPLRAAERLGVRVGMTTALSVTAAVALTTAAGLSHSAVRLLGVFTTSMLFGLIAYALVGTSSTLTTFLTRTPLVAVPLIAPALVSYSGLSAAPLLLVSPLTSALHMMAGAMSWSGLALQLVCIAGAGAVVAWTAQRPVLDHPAPVPRAARRTVRRHPGRYRPAAAVRSFARTDRRAIVGDALLVLLGLSVPLVALATRIIGTAGASWVRRRYGIDLVPHLPLFWALLLVLHTPIIFGALTGLLLLEDRDGGLLSVIATTRASVATLLAYRLTAAAAATAVALAVSLPLAGVVHPAGAPGVVGVVVAAAALSAVPALAMAGLAGNRVQAVAVMKVIGVPLYLPLASWFLTGAERWLFAPLPSAWAAWALWATTPAAASTAALGAVALTVAVAAPLTRRFLVRAGEAATG